MRVRKDSKYRKAKPFLKWAGGKQGLLDQYGPLFPKQFERYFEPFVGSGAVFFHLWSTGCLPGEVFLFDHNEELINAFRVVRDRLDDLVEKLAYHQENHSKSYYYHIRELDRHDVVLDDVERAARTIYLNKTCYNGLYRVNKKGQFNVPMGSYKNPNILDEPTLRNAQRALQSISLETCDFRSIPDFAQPGDFFYFDPPYHPLSETASFTSYTSGDFGENDQEELAEVFAQLSKKGCLCMLSNSHTPLIHRLYRGYRIEKVQANRAINSKVTNRKPIDEVLVLNY